MEDRFINLKHFEELLNIMVKRDSIEWYHPQYDKMDKKVVNSINWLRRNAKTKEELCK